MAVQTPENAAQTISRIADNVLQTARRQEAKENQAPTATDPALAAESPEGQAVANAAPVTEGDKMAEDAVVYEVDFGGDKRKLTPQQIRGTYERYAALNAQHAAMKPIIELTSRLMERTKAKPEQLAQFMMTAMQAAAHNPTLGQKQQQQSPPTATTTDQPAPPADDDPLAAWERENAVSLPPGYRESASKMANIERMLAQTQQMLAQVLSGTRGVVDAAAATGADARARQIDAVKRQIANNLAAVQQALQLPDEAEQDFMMFAAERGYTMEDFADPELAMRVAQDFKNNMNSPEMERLRAIMQKRQAYTGSLGSPAGTGAAADQPAPSRFERMVQGAMASRGL